MNQSGWSLITKQLEPDIQELCMFLEKGFHILLDLRQISHGWEITLRESYPDYIQYPYTPEISQINQRLDWIEQQLNNWKGVHRSGYESWQFDEKNIADKFIMLYNMTWS